jgi:hypothetical protein
MKNRKLPAVSHDFVQQHFEAEIHKPLVAILRLLTQVDFKFPAKNFLLCG